MTRFSVSDLLKKVTNAMKLTAEDSGHMILVETEPNLPPMVGEDVYKRQMQQYAFYYELSLKD